MNSSVHRLQSGPGRNHTSPPTGSDLNNIAGEDRWRYTAGTKPAMEQSSSPAANRLASPIFSGHLAGSQGNPNLVALRATSPWLLAISASIHGILILALIVTSTTLVKPPKPQRKTFAKVRLVGPPGPPAVQKIQTQVTKETRTQWEHLERVVPREMESKKRRAVAVKTVASKPSDLIQLKKRRRKVKHVAALPKNKPQKPSKKRETSRDYLKRRFEVIRERLKRKKSQTASASRAADTGAFGRQAASDLTDAQIARWFNGIRDKVNAHWSVFWEERGEDRVTVIGVQLADDGKLLNADVDESSGDPIFDRSAMRAIFQAAPFPPVPPKIREKIRHEGGLALRFTPGGMQ